MHYLLKYRLGLKNCPVRTVYTTVYTLYYEHNRSKLSFCNRLEIRERQSEKIRQLKNDEPKPETLIKQMLQRCQQISMKRQSKKAKIIIYPPFLRIIFTTKTRNFQGCPRVCGVQETKPLGTPVNYEICLYFTIQKTFPQKLTFSIVFTNENMQIEP